MTLATNGLNTGTKVYTWTYADAAGRAAASGFAAGDVGSLALQLDDGSLWRLTATTPTWQAINNGMANPLTTAGDIIVAGAGGTPTRVAKGANNTVWGVDGSGVLGYKADPSGEGGGSGYTPPPAASSLTWANQGTATATDETAALYLSVVNGGTEVARLLRGAAPATPYTFTVALAPSLAPGTVGYCGLGWREAASGNMHLLRWHNDRTLATTKHDTNGAGVAHYIAPTVVPIGNNLLWLRLADDGTNRVCSYSTDGKHWAPFHSIARTDYLTPDQIGVFVGGNSGQQAAAAVLSWAVA